MMNEMALNPILAGRTVWPALFELETPDFHFEMCKEMMDLSIRQFNIIAPRDYAKSAITIQLMGMLWHAFLEDRYRWLMYYYDWRSITGRKEKPPFWTTPVYVPEHKFICIASYTQDMSKDLIDGIRGDVFRESEGFAYYFGGNMGEKHPAIRRDTNEIFDFMHEGVRKTYIAKGCGQQVRGKRKGVRRFTFFGADDIEGEQNTKTPESMHENIKWLLGAARYSLDSIRGRAVLVSTPQNKGCACEKLSRRGSRWKTLRYPAIVNDGLTSARALWPAKETLEELREDREAHRAIGMLGVFNREKMAKASGGEDSNFPVESQRWWRGELMHHGMLHYLILRGFSAQGTMEFDDLPEPKILPVTVFMGVDPAAGTSVRAARTAITTVAVDANDNWFIMPYFAQRGIKSYDIIQHVEIEYNRYHPLWVRFEDVGFQEAVSHQARQAYSHWSIRTERKPFPLTMQPHFQGGKVFLPYEGGHVDGRSRETLMSVELADFPLGEHDDTVMSLFFATYKRWGPTHDVPDTLLAPKTQKKERRRFTGDWVTE